MIGWNVFGFLGFNSAGSVVKWVIILLGLCWLLLAISKVIFKKAFYNNVWEGIFVFMIGFPTFATLFTGSICALTYAGLPGQNMTILYVFGEVWSDISVSYYPILQLFFVIYLIHTFLRLWRYKKKHIASVD